MKEPKLNISDKESNSPQNKASDSKSKTKLFEVINNCYFFYDDKGKKFASNFVIRNTHLIKGREPKRVIEATNTYNHKEIFVITSEDFASIQKFKGKIEGLGNYIWFGTSQQFNIIKSHIFRDTKEANEITFLGYNPDYNIYCFSNGLYDGTRFVSSDNDGFCSLGKRHFYIPFASSINENNNHFDNYRKFIHLSNKVTFDNWSKQFIRVFGNNGIIALSYILALLFRDIIFSKLHFFPHLFLFGPPQSGKSAQSDSIMSLFGVPQPPINLEAGSTAVGSFRKLEQISNAAIAFNEFKSNLDPKLIGMLKAAYDGQGREQGLFTNDSATKSSKIRSGLIIAGQDIPANDPALFSRIIPLTYTKHDTYTHEQTEDYNKLRDMEKMGVTSVTLELLKFREKFISEFPQKYRIVIKQLKDEYRDSAMAERSIDNFAVLQASIEIIQTKLSLPFNLKMFKDIVTGIIIEYSSMLKESSDVYKFWEAFENLCIKRILSPDVHYAIRNVPVKNNNHEVIFIRWRQVYPEYRKWVFEQRGIPLNEGTLLKYLKNSPEYMCSENTRFGIINISAHWFYYDKLKINIKNE